MLKGHSLTIEGKTYMVSFPNVGQMMEIESFKLVYTKNKYVQLAMSDLKGHTFALDIADALAYFSVLIPDFKKNLDVKDWWAIDAFLAKRLIKVYREQFTPWLAPILKDLYNFDEKEEANAGEANQ